MSGSQHLVSAFVCAFVWACLFVGDCVLEFWSVYFCVCYNKVRTILLCRRCKARDTWNVGQNAPLFPYLYGYF